MSHFQWSFKNEQEGSISQTGRIQTRGWKVPFCKGSKTSHTPLVKVRHRQSRHHLCVALQMTASKDAVRLNPARTQAEEVRSDPPYFSFRKHVISTYSMSFSLIRYTVQYKCPQFEPLINRSTGWHTPHSKVITCM